MVATVNQKTFRDDVTPATYIPNQQPSDDETIIQPGDKGRKGSQKDLTAILGYYKQAVAAADKQNLKGKEKEDAIRSFLTGVFTTKFGNNKEAVSEAVGASMLIGAIAQQKDAKGTGKEPDKPKFNIPEYA